MNKILTYTFWIIIFIGFIIRCFSISYPGSFDIDTYNEWGTATLNNGLHTSFHGIYFPFQYQIFEFASWISIVSNINYYIVFKLVNLIFDCGNLVMLFFILNKLQVSKYYLLLYWIHPWYFNMLSLGYCDFQFTFFILGTLYFTLKDTSKNYLIAGIFLGFAFLMKPQVQVVFLAFFIYSVIIYLKNRDLKTLHIFVFPLIIFIDYALYFLIKSGSPYKLVSAYIHVANMMPCLNANFLNGWFPVAYFLKGTDDPIYIISDEMSLSGIYIRHIAMIAVLVLVYYFIRLVYKKTRENENNLSFYLIACFSSLVVPFIMTSAHENHLFLFSVIVIPVLAKAKSLVFKISIHIILLLQFINLYGYYGLGDIKSDILKRYNYTYEIALILSFIATITFLILLYCFLSKKHGLLSRQVINPDLKNE